MADVSEDGASFSELVSNAQAPGADREEYARVTSNKYVYNLQQKKNGAMRITKMCGAEQKCKTTNDIEV